MDKAEYSSDEEISFLPLNKQCEGKSKRRKLCMRLLALVSLLTSVFVLAMIAINGGVAAIRSGISKTCSLSPSTSTKFGQIFPSVDASSYASAIAGGGFGYAEINMDGSRHEELDCGTTMESAMANGCVFDEMLNGWVPPRCHNETMAQEALRDNTKLAALQAAGHFPWYEDIEFTRPIAQGQLSHYLEQQQQQRSDNNNMIAYTLEKWHMAHCLYVWRLGMLAMNRIQNGEKDVYVNVRITGEGHITHCNRVIADQEHRVGAKAIVSFGFGKCAKMT